MYSRIIGFGYPETKEVDITKVMIAKTDITYHQYTDYDVVR